MNFMALFLPLDDIIQKIQSCDPECGNNVH